jgi:cystathionine beta-lyase/cystathionine gamma-synthase
MTPDGQPTAHADLHPETAVICVGRPGHAAGGPLNTPIVLASNFHAGSTGEDGRAYSRTDATPGREALETTEGQVEAATPWRSPPAGRDRRRARPPAGRRRIVALEDCYFGVGGLLADAASTAAGSSTAWT